jgi:hypothetical protein
LQAHHCLARCQQIGRGFVHEAIQKRLKALPD